MTYSWMNFQHIFWKCPRNLNLFFQSDYFLSGKYHALFVSRRRCLIATKGPLASMVYRSPTNRSPRFSLRTFEVDFSLTWSKKLFIKSILMQWIFSIFRKCYNISKKCWKFITWKMLEIKSRHLTWVGPICIWWKENANEQKRNYLECLHSIIGKATVSNKKWCQVRSVLHECIIAFL